MPDDLYDTIRTKLRAHRGRDVSAEAVAKEARELGLTWTRATVADIEVGRRRVAAHELLALPLVLSAATGKPVRLVDLIGDGVSLGDSITLTPQNVRNLLHGEPVDIGYESLSERKARAILARYETSRKKKGGKS